ncbi:MAG: CPBP family intramembrane metalloprotease [Holophagaceae bacterium]|nr:CPBP family intramembrane metalloprotease [Holophagaceae bacterium]
MDISDNTLSQRSSPFADPLSIVLFIIATLLTLAQIGQRVASPVVYKQAGPEARIIELQWAGKGQFGRDFKVPDNIPSNPWTVAVEMILLSEEGQATKARELLPHSPEGVFRKCWEAAYIDDSQSCEPEMASTIRDGLSNGLASKLLEASLMTRAENESTKIVSQKLRSDALKSYKNKAMVLFALVFVLIFGAGAGIAIGIWMLVKPKPITPPPHFEMPAVTAIRVCLGWYVVFLSSATIVSLIDSFISLGILALPFSYVIHAVSGISFICFAEKISPFHLWKKICQPNMLWVPKGLQFLLLAIGYVMLVAIILSYLLPEEVAAQQELLRFIRTTKGILPFIFIFGMVAILGPAFEEIFFRGFLMSILRRRFSIIWSLVFSSLLFGAIHFQLQNLLVLTFLGGALGFSFLSTRDIRTAIFVHGCWNGGVFLFQKLLLG